MAKIPSSSNTPGFQRGGVPNITFSAPETGGGLLGGIANSAMIRGKALTDIALAERASLDRSEALDSEIAMEQDANDLFAEAEKLDTPAEMRAHVKKGLEGFSSKHSELGTSDKMRKEISRKASALADRTTLKIHNTAFDRQMLVERASSLEAAGILHRRGDTRGAVRVINATPHASISPVDKQALVSSFNKAGHLALAESFVREGTFAENRDQLGFLDDSELDIIEEREEIKNNMVLAGEGAIRVSEKVLADLNRKMSDPSEIIGEASYTAGIVDIETAYSEGILGNLKNPITKRVADKNRSDMLRNFGYDHERALAFSHFADGTLARRLSLLSEEERYAAIKRMYPGMRGTEQSSLAIRAGKLFNSEGLNADQRKEQRMMFEKLRNQLLSGKERPMSFEANFDPAHPGNAKLNDPREVTDIPITQEYLDELRKPTRVLGDNGVMKDIPSKIDDPSFWFLSNALITADKANAEKNQLNARSLEMLGGTGVPSRSNHPDDVDAFDNAVSSVIFGGVPFSSMSLERKKLAMQHFADFASKQTWISSTSEKMIDAELREGTAEERSAFATMMRPILSTKTGGQLSRQLSTKTRSMIEVYSGGPEKVLAQDVLEDESSEQSKRMTAYKLSFASEMKKDLEGIKSIKDNNLIPLALQLAEEQYANGQDYAHAQKAAIETINKNSNQDFGHFMYNSPTKVYSNLSPNGPAESTQLFKMQLAVTLVAHDYGYTNMSRDQLVDERVKVVKANNPDIDPETLALYRDRLEDDAETKQSFNFDSFQHLLTEGKFLEANDPNRVFLTENKEIADVLTNFRAASFPIYKGEGDKEILARQTAALDVLYENTDLFKISWDPQSSGKQPAYRFKIFSNTKGLSSLPDGNGGAMTFAPSRKWTKRNIITAAEEQVFNRSLREDSSAESIFRSVLGDPRKFKKETRERIGRTSGSAPILPDKRHDKRHR